MITRVGPVDEITSRSPLRSPAFRRVWAGANLSAAGDAASWVALVALTLRRPDGDVAVLAVCYTAPVAAGGWWAGWALDRFDRRRLIAADSVLRAAVFASVPLAAAAGSLSAAQLYLVAAVYGLLKMISLAGFPALIPALVPAGQQTAANALEGAGYGIAGLAGAALGGLAVATAGPGPVVAADAATYLAYAAALVSVPSLSRNGPGRTPAASPPGADTRIRPILKLLATDNVLRDTTVLFALFNIGEGALLVFLPHRAQQLGLGTGGYGFLVAATTGGELLVSAMLVRWSWRRPLAPSILVAQLVAALTVLCLLGRSSATTLVALAAMGMCTAPMTAWAQTLRMRAAPTHQHGRLFAVLRTLMQATPPLGAALAAATRPHGEALTVLLAAAVMGIPVLFLAPDLLATQRVPVGAEREPERAT